MRGVEKAGDVIYMAGCFGMLIGVAMFAVLISKWGFHAWMWAYSNVIGTSAWNSIMILSGLGGAVVVCLFGPRIIKTLN